MQELTTGWLSPTGEFFPTELYEHISKAEKLARTYIPNCPNQAKYGWDDELISKGWVAIYLNSFLAREWLFSSFEHRLTPEQIQFLEPYTHDTIPLNVLSLEHYNGER